MARYFLHLASAKYGKKMSSIAPDAMKLLESYNWPGNVRQLEHMIGQIVITNHGKKLTLDMLPDEITKYVSEKGTQDLIQSDSRATKVIPSMEEMEHNLILQALELSNGSVRQTAKQLGISEATLYRKMKKFGISRTFTEQ